MSWLGGLRQKPAVPARSTAPAGRAPGQQTAQAATARNGHSAHRRDADGGADSQAAAFGDDLRGPSQQITITDLAQVPDYRGLLETDLGLSAQAQKSLCVLDLVDERIGILFAPGRPSVGPQDVARLRQKLENRHLLTGRQTFRPVKVFRVEEHVISSLRMRQESRAEADAAAAAIADDSVYREIFREMIEKAVVEGVSDVHFERQGEDGRVRFHRPGGMQTVRTMAGAFLLRMGAVVYDTMADSDAKETKYVESSPQKARATVVFEKFRAELRIQTVPAFPLGSDMIVRILAVVRHDNGNGKTAPPTLAQAGYLPQAQRMISDAVSMPNGMIVFCGTVNSGKSTTIANLFRRMIADNQGRLKVMTLEDPPESTIDGATQVPVEQVRHSLKNRGDADPEANAYAEGIKIALRSDIHKLIVGEIRGAELALPLTHAVRSGHFTATTIHAGSSVEAVSRMIDLGMRPEDLSSPGFLNAVVYQRLLPGLCPHCRKTSGAFPEVLASLRGEINAFARLQTGREPQFHWRNPEGCEHCEGGVNRRLLVAEVLFPDDEMRLLIRDRKMIELRDAWTNSGALPVAHHALLRCIAGDVDPADMVLEGVRWTDVRDWVRRANDMAQPISYASPDRRAVGAEDAIVLVEAASGRASRMTLGRSSGGRLTVHGSLPGVEEGSAVRVNFGPADGDARHYLVRAKRAGRREGDGPDFVLLELEPQHA